MYTSSKQTAYDNKRADECADEGEITHCPDCGKRLYQSFFGDFMSCVDSEYCGWTNEVEDEE